MTEIEYAKYANYGWIKDDLEKSGLTVDVFPVEPLRSETELQERLGFTVIQDELGNWIKIIGIGGYWIPYPNVPGYYRLKLRYAIQTENGTAKYLSPLKKKGFGNRPYIPSEVEKLLRNYSPDKPIFITEGEKKAAKATLEGIPTIGLSGVSCYKDQKNDFLPELEELVWKDRTVYIIFDSDITDKFLVGLAEIRIAVELINRGAKVYSVRLPNLEVEQ
ncbi:MAG: DUF3854 domain-containing protein [Ignavibacteriales bacterium]